MSKKVLVIYHSQEHGNTAAVAELVAQGIRERGDINVDLVNTNVINRIDMSSLANYDGFAIGSPDYCGYVAGTIKQFFDDLFPAMRSGLAIAEKPCVLFMTHGGGGRGLQALIDLAKRLNVIDEPFVCQGHPEEGCTEAVALGRTLGKAIQ